MSATVRELPPAGPTGVEVAGIVGGVEDVKPALEAVVLTSPVKRQSCSRCGLQERCKTHMRVTGHMLCEPLTAWDLLVAANEGAEVVQETVHWQQWPESLCTVEGVTGYIRRCLGGR